MTSQPQPTADRETAHAEALAHHWRLAAGAHAAQAEDWAYGAPQPGGDGLAEAQAAATRSATARDEAWLWATRAGTPWAYQQAALAGEAAGDAEAAAEAAEDDEDDNERAERYS